MKNYIKRFIPLQIQNLAISLYNTYLYRIRHGGEYKRHYKYYSNLDYSDADYLFKEQSRRLDLFLKHSVKNSQWYHKFRGFGSLSDFPILNKDNLINRLDEIKTVSDKEGIVSLTGGTTGASMKVIYTPEDMQERFAILDSFRASYGYKLGKKVGWFSGKSIVTSYDISKGVCYRDDLINKIRFYSTFHITDDNFECYWKALNEFSPEFLVGFPSSVFDICSFAEQRGLKYSGNIKVFFTTAETVLPKHRDLIGRILGCILVDQYASSEGAPFILECQFGVKHIHILTGFFEIVDDELNPTNSGELLVTSFTTHGTPLIRYKIGDRVTLDESGNKCKCGSSFPIVKSIDGRTSDYILSPDNGKVNLGNLSNSTKDVLGLMRFQIVQDHFDSVEVYMIVNELFDDVQKITFSEALKLRLGTSMAINLHVVDTISNERSGKFRFVKNNLKLD